MSFVFDAPHAPSLSIVGSRARFPVHRIYCIGRNYADHAKEMGAAADRAQPVFFLKPADAIVPEGGEIAYPAGTADLHHEVEMVVALASGGRDIPVDRALEHVFGYGVGLDLTRRDLQATAKAKGLPWDAAKAFDDSAPTSALRRADEIRHPRKGRLTLSVNGTLRQRADIADMLLKVPEIIHELSKLWELVPGDLVFTGTPAGVAAIARGDRFRAELEGVAVMEGRIV
ncbi:MAG TPA: fumarylacetoacetate hydrolase family protein [Rhodanobacteraceae bacterium]|jgi:fumarylpyruvate hydrolase|nr:fumarylacetoacetate hydrolase family protein [Rhodanobacteraceae bacterium]